MTRAYAVRTRGFDAGQLNPRACDFTEKLMSLIGSAALVVVLLAMEQL